MSLSLPGKDIGLVEQGGNEHFLVASPGSKLQSFPVVQLSLIDLALPPRRNRQPVIQFGQDADRQAWHKSGFEKAFDHVPFACRSKPFEQRARGQESSRRPLVVRCGKLIRGILHQQIAQLAFENFRESDRIFLLDELDLTLKPANDGFAIDAHLFREPPLLDSKF